MFAQVIHGQVTDAPALQALGERWYAELSPGATGWLGSTTGVTADGVFVIFAWFESAESARRNSDRPEQGEWWAEAEQCFSGEPAFGDYDGVIKVRNGGVAEAGFVQLMLGQTSNPARERELSELFTEQDPGVRADILGGLVGISDDGHFAQAFYFSSEAEAREGEKQPMPAEFAESFAEEQQLTTEMRFLDLTDPKTYLA
jgi:hypothetical protein